jgi:hypothetical protein
VASLRDCSKEIREGEEVLMLAVLENAIECFRNMFSPTAKEKKDYSKKPRSGFWRKIAIDFLLRKYL